MFILGLIIGIIIISMLWSGKLDDIEREYQKEIDNLIKINEEHKKINGNLRKELKNVQNTK